MLTRNTSFCETIPTHQIALDSTSITVAKECLRKYQLSIIHGYQPRNISVHLTFGLHTHAAREVYERAKAKGNSHQQSLREALRFALTETWDSERKRPWISDDPNKNRWTLIRTLVWYLDQFEHDPCETIILSDGKPAIELSFRFESTYKSSFTGEPYILCGHLDRVAQFGGTNYILDIKTTKHTLSNDFFSTFSPGNQFSLYTLASRVAFSAPVSGVMVDAAQVAVTFSRFLRGIVPRTDDQLNEWYRDLGYLIERMEKSVRDNYWPMNDTACGNYGGCPFRAVCGMSPTVREKWLETGFVKRIWDPLQIRGDI